MRQSAGRENEMSRFVLLTAQEIAVNGTRRYLRAGRTIADSPGNALPGDVVAPDLCVRPNDRLVPLDAPAVAAMKAYGYANAAIGVALVGPASGAESLSG